MDFAKIGESLKEYIGKDILGLLSFNLNNAKKTGMQKDGEYLAWINARLVDFAQEFNSGILNDSRSFVEKMNNLFNTDRFELLLKRWTVEYLFDLFNILYEYSYSQGRQIAGPLTLEDNPLNRFAVERYCAKFKSTVNISWKKPRNKSKQSVAILFLGLNILCQGIKSGFFIFARKKKLKVMREAIWGLDNTGEYFFHDDFLVDNKIIKKDELLLFSRKCIKECALRKKAYLDAVQSEYKHFYLPSLRIKLSDLIRDILPDYLVKGIKVLSGYLNSRNFSFFLNAYWYFVNLAVPYEKVFSNFEITSELGHNFFSATHIPEAIVCQRHGVRYYLMHWSDNSVDINKPFCSFLACDKYLIWGRAHFRGVEVGPGKIEFTGYPFKGFIKQIAAKKEEVLGKMGIARIGKVVVFFDEGFGNNCLMPEQHFIAFWEAALRLGRIDKEDTIVIKPKDLAKIKDLSKRGLGAFLKIKNELELLPNAYILDSLKWSFIEAIGVADIVITQGMTSSSTIAIICGIEGLYLDPANYKHPFRELYQDKVVFNDSEKLIAAIQEIIIGSRSVLRLIPESLLREYDEFNDERGLDLFRNILAANYAPKKRVGIIIQARMGSTRLPGKVMLELEGEPVLWHIFNRLKYCQGADEVILATTTQEKDGLLAELAKKNRIKIFRGSEDDVLSRYYYAASENKLDVVIRVTADCPLIDPQIIDEMTRGFLDKPGTDFLANTIKRTFPRGLDVEILSFAALQKAFSEAKGSYAKEHVTPYIYENKGLFNIRNFENSKDLSGLRWTLDEEKDFEFIKEIYKRLYLKDKLFVTQDILDILEKEPYLGQINSQVKQKCGVR